MRHQRVTGPTSATLIRYSASMNPECDHARIDEGAQLLRQSALGDQAAFSRLYDLYSGLLYSIACRMLGVSQDAEDAVQDAFVQAWKQARNFDADRGSARAWMVLLTRSRCLDRLRRRMVRNHHESAYVAEESLLIDIDRTLTNEEWEATNLRALVTKAMWELPANQRQVIEKAFFEALSHSEIAQQLDEPLGTIKTRMRLAAHKLAQRLRQVWEQ